MNRKGKTYGNFIMIGILILISWMLIPQETAAQVIPPPNPSIGVSIVSGHTVQFHFNEIDEYKNGILNGGQSTFIRIGSVTDWTLTFKADQTMFYGNDNPANQMELNNVGVTVISTGTNLDNGSNIINFAKNVPLALDDSEVILMTKGSLSNKGYGIRNSFTLNWEMGTSRGNMNNVSLLDQMVHADTYMLNIILTVTTAQ